MIQCGVYLEDILDDFYKLNIMPSLNWIKIQTGITKNSGHQCTMPTMTESLYVGSRKPVSSSAQL